MYCKSDPQCSLPSENKTKSLFKAKIYFFQKEVRSCYEDKNLLAFLVSASIYSQNTSKIAVQPATNFILTFYYSQSLHFQHSKDIKNIYCKMVAKIYMA